MRIKEIGLDKTIFKLTDQYKGLIEIPTQGGFLSVKNLLTRNILGHEITLKGRL